MTKHYGHENDKKFWQVNVTLMALAMMILTMILMAMVHLNSE